MENKYYTPDVSDIHLGYELEVEELEKADNNPDDADGKWWKKVIIDSTVDEDIYEFCGNSITGIKNRDIVYVRNTFRTPYLTKEQIEAEGWVEMSPPIISISREFRNIPFIKDGYRLDYNINSNQLAITISREFLFYGECKSINELRIICKLLNIK